MRSTLAAMKSMGAQPAKVSLAAQPSAWARGMLLTATLAVLAVTLIVMVVSVLPVAYFDTDPRIKVDGVGDADVKMTDLGPAGAAWLQVIAVAAAAVALAAHTAVGGKLRWGVCALAAIGAAVCGWHLRDASQPTTAGAWIAAAALGVAACHLAQHEEPRRWIAAALLAMLVPLTLQTLVAVYVDHPATVASFRAAREEFLKARGWLPGSPQAILYERRLMFPDAVGAMGLSNVYASILAALVMLAGAWTVNLWRRGGRLAASAGVVLVGMGLFSLHLTHSRGAPAGLALAIMAAAVWGAATWWRMRRGGMMVGAAVLAMIALTLGLVLARGAMGPPVPAPAGLGADDPTLSVYFRAQYWGAAARVMQTADWRTRVLGVGPDGFKERYLTAKDPLNPEEVESTHNVFLDWIVMLGVGGAAWAMLALMWVWCAVMGSVSAKPQAPPEFGEKAVYGLQATPQRWDQIDSRCVVVALGLTMAVFGTQLALQWSKMTPEAGMAWVFGAAGFMVMWVLGVTPAWSGGSRWVALGLLLAAAVLLIHNQIEMTFFNPAAAWPAWVMLAAAGASGGETPNRKRGREVGADEGRGAGAGFAAAAVGLAGAVWMAAVYATPVTVAQAALARAAAALKHGDTAAAIAGLDAAAQWRPHDPTTLRWRVTLRLDAAAHRHRTGRTDHAQRAVREALAVLDEAFAQGLDTTAALRLRAQALQWAGREFGDSATLHTAAAVRRELVARNPFGLQDAVALGDLLWSLGRSAEASAAYTAALNLDAQSYLDPGKRLSEAERKRLEARTGGAGLTK
jgi:tetratricopeptide (TPR) repeat protein